ncbi:ATP-binding protein [Acidipila rosea]|uniref:histidine kinase n=1 Tax=Acidipila rosea TaxID=768535 RepID=A0A4R1LEW8_9BACT|nr:ATP-binding protein [Acidipila rosea]TCK75393.1 histidine kinase/DNA gyrase B/HSP90-like ATPase [Acidipila rosea]
MTDANQSSPRSGPQDIVDSKIVPAQQLYSELKQIPVFAHIKPADLECLGDVEVVEMEPGSFLLREGEANFHFWVLLQGEIRAYKVESDRTVHPIATLKSGDTFGEVPILIGSKATSVNSEVITPSRLISISREGFWRLMATCPVVRQGILENMARRLESYQAITLHREKLISLGTLAAGLMHELNNPGAAARRAASQLRDNLFRLQQISLKFTHADLTPTQMECMRNLQERILSCKKAPAMSSIEQSDAEEELSEWLENAGVENAWKMAPSLVAIGWKPCDIECAQHEFSPELFSDSLNWLEALISSVQHVAAIEESVARVTDLVIAVKKYAYDDKISQQGVDIHDSIQSTLTILGHKFRNKQLTVEKDFAPELPIVVSGGSGLSQVWTNLLDNAIDASPEKGAITVKTWVDGPIVCVSIADEGPGIAAASRSHIFEPFFTTKPVGVGTGLGLDIVHRIVVGQYRGAVTFTSEPGRTVFLVQLPVGKRA